VPTYRVDLSYDGTGFHGYAKQPEVRTVQGDLETALERILGTLVTTVAGRTDRGVHAVGQVVSFEHPDVLDSVRITRSLNSLLGAEIAISSVVEAPSDFNARKSAVTRRYRYQVLNRSIADPFRRNVSWHVHQRLDAAAMNEAAQLFLGEQDFSAFCRDDDGKSRKRYVLEAGWSTTEDLLVFEIEANAFCHQMVRSLVAMCVEVGKGNRTVDEVAGIMAGRDRNAASGTAPPQGLTLVHVSYEGDRWHP